MMFRLKRVLLAVVVLASVLAVASAAMAGHEDYHDEDTQFSFGYDDLNHVLAINLGPNYEAYDCALANGALTATYGGADLASGVIPVDMLDDGFGDKTFPSREVAELRDDVELKTGTAPYDGAEGVCGVSGVVVAGPNGQINHGQVLKAAKSLIDIQGQGCVVRYLAKSDIGRTDETKVGPSDSNFEVVAGDSGIITFSTPPDADCSHGNSNKDVGATNQGKKDRTGSPGKSSDAPGKNK